jgi:hypothetical protein
MVQVAIHRHMFCLLCFSVSTNLRYYCHILKLPYCPKMPYSHISFALHVTIALHVLLSQSLPNTSTNHTPKTTAPICTINTKWSSCHLSLTRWCKLHLRPLARCMLDQPLTSVKKMIPLPSFATFFEFESWRLPVCGFPSHSRSLLIVRVL